MNNIIVKKALAPNEYNQLMEKMAKIQEESVHQRQLSQELMRITLELTEVVTKLAAAAITVEVVPGEEENGDSNDE